MKSLYKVFITCALILLTGLCTFNFSVVNAASTENTWEVLASMPTARDGLGVVAVDGKIYAIGGPGHYENEMYDPATNTWTVKNALPLDHKWADFSSTACGNKIYVFGIGYVYDTKTGSWTKLTKPPTGRYDASACTVDEKIYLMGGMTGDGVGQRYVKANEMYDPATDTWTSKAPLPYYYMDHAVSIALDSKIYLFGTNDMPNNGPFNVQIYDTKTNSWQTGLTIPQKVYSGAATSGIYAPKKIYLFGDGCSLVYDPQTQIWGNGAPPPASFGFGIAVVNDSLFAIGSGHGNWKFTPFGYSLPSPTSTVSPNVKISSPSGLTFTLSGVVVAAAVIVVAGVLLFRKKHVKPDKSVQTI